MIIEQDFGYWAPKPGSILADGSIVTGRRGAVVFSASYGDIYLETRRATLAGEYGWEIRGFVRDDLVIVSRGAPYEPSRYLLPPVGLP